ncbi:hypothetical protein HanRHA438_Chr03g0134791 [Helianthus annuus]|nr:hypothetical protein HanRHA438_Chr03g0134791 [Helianthus annuus]
MRLLYFHHAPVLAGHGPWWAMEASTGLSFLLLPGHALVFAGHGACSDSVSFFLPWEVPLRVRAVYFCSFSCIYGRISGLFASFVILSSFHPENTKGRQKHSFSNIST